MFDIRQILRENGFCGKVAFCGKMSTTLKLTPLSLKFLQQHHQTSI
jgi:hypothetical protein